MSAPQKKMLELCRALGPSTQAVTLKPACLKLPGLKSMLSICSPSGLTLALPPPVSSISNTSLRETEVSSSVLRGLGL